MKKTTKKDIDAGKCERRSWSGKRRTARTQSGWSLYCPFCDTKVFVNNACFAAGTGKRCVHCGALILEFEAYRLPGAIPPPPSPEPAAAPSIAADRPKKGTEAWWKIAYELAEYCDDCGGITGTSRGYYYFHPQSGCACAEDDDEDYDVYDD